MDELRKNQNALIEMQDKTQIEASILDFTFDRVLIEIKEEFVPLAKNIKELEELTITIDTHLGSKKMNSSVISTLDSSNRLLVENNPAYIVITKREFSRVKTKLDFVIVKNKKEYNATAIDISGNGIGFSCNEIDFKIDEIIEIKLTLNDNQITTKAKIVKTNNDVTAATYQNIDSKMQDKIVKYVFEQSTKK